MKKQFFTIQGKKIGQDYPCFIVAEISGNHHQKFEEAVGLIHAAAKAGADAIKLQTYTPDTITLRSRKKWFIVGGKDQPDLWKKKTLYELYQKAYTPWEWQPKLKKIAEDLGLILFSTPFDETAVDFLESMNVPCYKVASYEVVHTPLLKKIAGAKKPVIMSLGFASLEDIEYALGTLRENGARDIALLHCVTAYSDVPEFQYANLNTIIDIREKFKVVSGFSDNNSGIEIPVIAAEMTGASIIEKHIIMDRSKGGPDARFSLEPDELKQMVLSIRRSERENEGLSISVSTENVKQMLGNAHYGPASEKEAENKVFRPSVWVKKDIKKGEPFTLENIRVARPSHGLEPKFFHEVTGRKAAQDIKRITPLSRDMIV